MGRVGVTSIFPAVFVLLWSSGFVGAKLGLPYAEPFTFLSLRFVLVVSILLPLCWLTGARWPAPRGIAHMAFAGALLQAAYLGGVFAALSRGLPTGLSALITALQPILTAVLSSWLLGERTRPTQWLGLFLGVAGVGLVVGDRIVVQGLGLIPVALAFFSLASITLGTVWQKRHGVGVDLRTGAAIQFAAAALVVAPFAFALETREIHWSAEFALALAWLVFGLSFGAIFLLLYLIRHGAATKVASLFYLVPPTTAVIAWPLFGETYSATAAAGMALAVVAVWLVTRE